MIIKLLQKILSLKIEILNNKIFYIIVLNLIFILKLNSSIDVHTAIRTRRSIRKFKQTEIGVEILKQVVFDGSLAASSGNRQPWEFILITDKQKRKFIFDNIKWLKISMPIKKDQQPTAYIIVLGNSQKSNEYKYDCSAAIQNILLSAWGFGIGSCWIGAINKKNIYEGLKIPKHMDIVGIVALGYPDEMPEIKFVEKNVSVTPYINNNNIIVPKYNIKEILYIEEYGNKSGLFNK